MDKGQYWILSTLVERGCGLRLLEPGFVEYHFFPGHGLSLPELVDTLERFVEAGDVFICREYPDAPPEQSVRQITPTRSEIEALVLSDDRNVSIFLTPQGDALWESRSAPDWNRFMSLEKGRERTEWCLLSIHREHIEHYLRQEIKGEPLQSHIAPGTLEWDEVVPWRATYWKTLPRGVMARFSIRERDDSESDAYLPPHPSTNWYIKPFDP